ncbi:putative enoyl-CoA hydratase precursor, mitochondrial [Suillus subaureus]|uniref:Enoyl-CoA hydratase, mitochondrial n=1 Tax=Suillus subaureus TaxID=48587 RepID=A0A9P7JBG2_9AGAM|nr:putative enoyl-CoA hydratase precursor, mitochondrial [Suillus subaureus]KAG1812574.1 putative enoyl-CoA hydratase precursor, mitochondrial [Suillus subaureus]
MSFVTFSRSTFHHVSSSARFFSTSLRAQREYANVLVSRPSPGVALITLNRPKALNALNAVHFQDISEAMKEADEDVSVGAIILTGSERAFAAGADIKEMKDKSCEYLSLVIEYFRIKFPEVAEAYTTNFLADWEVITQLKKPVIAAVSGYALGGGLELALQADILLAAPSAQLGQPEVNLGVIPGGGGTQRLARLVGKSRAMELVLTGRIIGADEAERWGIVRVVREGSVVDEAVKVASDIASKGRIAVGAGKEAVNAAFEMSLAEGLRFERRLFHALFSTKDQKEGMAAFSEKRRAEWTHS